MKFKKHVYIIAIISCLPTLYGAEMDPSIKKQITDLNIERAKCFKQLNQAGSDTRFAFAEQYRYRLAGIVRDAGDKMSDIDKLNYLEGDCFYSQRKEIIKSMIEKKVYPNIRYQLYENPLCESVLHEDISFTEYLLEKGAKPNQKILQTMNDNPKFTVLLSRYNLIKELEELNERWKPTMDVLSLNGATIMGMAEEYCAQRKNILSRYQATDSATLACPTCITQVPIQIKK